MQREAQLHPLGLEKYARESTAAMLQGVALVHLTLPNGLYNLHKFDRTRFGELFSNLKSLGSMSSSFNEVIDGKYIDAIPKDNRIKNYELRALGSHIADILWEKQSNPACRLALQRLLTVFPTALDPRRDAERGIPRARTPVSAQLKVSSDFLCTDSEEFYREFFERGRCMWVNNYFIVKDFEYTTLLPVVTFRATNGQVFIKGVLFMPSREDKTKIEEVYEQHKGMPKGKRVKIRNLSLRPARSLNPDYFSIQYKNDPSAFRDLMRNAKIMKPVSAKT